METMLTMRSMARAQAACSESVFARAYHSCNLEEEEPK